MTRWLALGAEGLDSLVVIVSIVASYGVAFGFTCLSRWVWAATAAGALSMFYLIAAVHIGV